MFGVGSDLKSERHLKRKSALATREEQTFGLCIK